MQQLIEQRCIQSDLYDTLVIKKPFKMLHDFYTGFDLSKLLRCRDVSIRCFSSYIESQFMRIKHSKETKLLSYFYKVSPFIEAKFFDKFKDCTLSILRYSRWLSNHRKYKITWGNVTNIPIYVYFLLPSIEKYLYSTRGQSSALRQHGKNMFRKIKEAYIFNEFVKDRLSNFYSCIDFILKAKVPKRNIFLKNRLITYECKRLIRSLKEPKNNEFIFNVTDSMEFVFSYDYFL